jgi:hypothetical protein
VSFVKIGEVEAVLYVWTYKVFSPYSLRFSPDFYKIQYVVDNKVHELATVCLQWQHWTKALVWFDDVGITAFHSCVVVDLWQSLSE